MIHSNYTVTASSTDASSAYQGRYIWMILIMFLAFSILIARLWYLQVYSGEEYYRASTENIIQDIEIKAPRGRIFDSNGVLLADNRPSFDLYMQPFIFGRHASDEAFDLLSQYLHLSDAEMARIKRLATTNYAESLIRRDITRDQVARLEEDQLRLPGIEVRARSHRIYPLNHISAHSIGFVGEVGRNELERLYSYGYRSGDYIGRMGLESAFEEILHGSPGIDRRVVDARGNPSSDAQTRFLIGEYQRVNPIAGRDIISTLDANLSLIIDDAMKQYPSGAVVAVDPRDGSVLALYSKPSFNPNSWSGRLSSVEKMRTDNDPFNPLLDKTVSAYFPASLYKIVASLAALSEGIMTEEDTVHCPGYYQFGGRRFRCWRRSGHGSVNVLEAMKHSCDVFYYKVADMLGMDKLAEYANLFGFGERSGLPINRESTGRVPTREWHQNQGAEGYQRGFDLNTVIGQGDTLSTPLQLALSYASIANGGTLYYPRVAREIRNAQGEVLFEFAPKIRKRIPIRSEHVETLRKSLWMTVQEKGGTAYNSRLADIEVGGKTGTAQVARIGAIRVANEDKDIHLRDHAWFAGYAPYDAPEIVVVVFLEHGGSGGAAAAPVAMNIIRRYLDDETTRLEAQIEPAYMPEVQQ